MILKNKKGRKQQNIKARLIKAYKLYFKSQINKKNRYLKVKNLKQKTKPI